MNRFGTLTTQRLVLRDIVLGDAEAFFAYKFLPESTKYQFWRPKSLEEIKEFIRGMQTVQVNAPGAWLQLAVCLKDAGAMIGDIGLHFPAEDKDEAEIGYTIAPEHWGRGYATEAVKAAAAYLLGALGKRSVRASADPRNAASIAVLEKAGFKKEAVIPGSVLMDGEWCDDAIYVLYKND
jgi:RimJ/RimL family protein N-acetyltransferase